MESRQLPKWGLISAEFLCLRVNIFSGMEGWKDRKGADYIEAFQNGTS